MQCAACKKEIKGSGINGYCVACAQIYNKVTEPKKIKKADVVEDSSVPTPNYSEDLVNSFFRGYRKQGNG